MNIEEKNGLDKVEIISGKGSNIADLEVTYKRIWSRIKLPLTDEISKLMLAALNQYVHGKKQLAHGQVSIMLGDMQLDLNYNDDGWWWGDDDIESRYFSELMRERDDTEISLLLEEEIERLEAVNKVERELSDVDNNNE